jgi:O-antigen ligase
MRLSSLRTTIRPSIPVAGLSILLCILLVAGGSARADAMGQVLVRSAAWAMVLAMLLIWPRPYLRRMTPVALILLAALALALLQLVPLPPAIWTVLPGRELVREASQLGGHPGWRSLSLAPGATMNAASSLIVPGAVLLLMAGMKREERQWCLNLLFGLIAIAMFVGLVQITGVAAQNALIKDSDAQISGIFSNRNHLALLLVLGCVIAPGWAASGGRGIRLRAVVAFGLVLLFVLTILAGGSRAGLALCLPGLAIGTWLAKAPILRLLRSAPKWVLPALVVGSVALVSGVVLISVMADRSSALDRFFTVDVAQDMRTRGLPVVLQMIRDFFPVGSGLGSFDPAFRIYEPDAFLKPTYFNHAHNDFLEVALDAGLPGVLLLASALLWWAWASIRAWRAPSGAEQLTARLGSVMLLFILLASASDYPARTPTIMAITMIAAIWLADCPRPRAGTDALTID